MWELIRYTLGYINKRSTSFSFSLGSIAYGFYHFFNSNILSYSNAYAAINNIFGFIGGRYFGLIIDNVYLKLPLYFVLLFLWLLLGSCFLVTFIYGSTNPSWIYCFTIALMSTNILKAHQQEIIIKDEVDG
ncbi:hypothetical protein SAMN04487887_1102 [Enterococcus casseliflavus]|nr:hypothetical protein SAMN04487887_1102 [Enterococcus casseliflavus]